MSLLEDFAQFVLDMQTSASYLAWARDNHGGVGYSIDNPKIGSELQKWMVFRDQILRGTRPIPPAMTTALGKGLVDGGVEYLDATAAPVPPPPPPQESADNTLVKDTVGKIVDAAGHIWKITATGKVSVDGTADPITSGVVELAYESKKIWQKNTGGLWWYKTKPIDSWLPTGGTTTSPVPGDVPPPPPPSGKLWGISPSNNGGYTAPLDQQFAAYKDLGAVCPRIPSGASDAALAAGIKQWKAWVTGDGSATVDQLVAYAKAYPEAIMVSFGNELNLNGWKAAAVAAKQIQVFNAFKAASLDPLRVGLSSIGNSTSSAEGLLPIDWARHLRSAGCVYGKGFGWNDVHMYSLDPQGYDKWMHVVTPDASGESIQSILGHPPFFVTEMGCKIGWVFGGVTVEEAHQAQAAAAWVAWCAHAPDCHGGDWFQLDDGSSWTGFGLIDGSGRKRPSYAAYKTALATYAAPLPTLAEGHDPAEFSALKLSTAEE